MDLTYLEAFISICVHNVELQGARLQDVAALWVYIYIYIYIHIYIYIYIYFFFFFFFWGGGGGRSRVYVRQLWALGSPFLRSPAQTNFMGSFLASSPP